MRGGFFYYYLLCILSVYCSCESVKRIKQVRKEKRMCCTEPKRAASASHCPERLRGFFVYTGGSVLFAGAHSPISNRTGTVFFPSCQPPRRLFASSTPRVFCCALTASVLLFVALRASLRSAGRRRANPNPFPQTSLTEPFRSGRDGKWPRSFMQLFRSTLPRLNEGDGARLKSTIKDAEPGVRGDSNPAARPGLFTAAAAPPVTGAQLPPLVSLCVRVRGRDFVSGEKLSVCDGGRDVCVRI